MTNYYELAGYYYAGHLKNAAAIGRRIEQIRKEELHLTQEDACDLLGTCERNYRRWIKGALNFERVFLIATAFQVNPMRLLADPGQQ